MQSITEQLKTIIASELNLNLKAEEIDENAPFFEEGLQVDSIAIIELIAATEEKFGIELADDDLVPETFESLSTLAGVIAGKVKQANP